MKIGKRSAAVIAAAGTTAAMLTGAATAADAATAGHVHHVTARMTKSSIRLSVGHTVHAGTIQFKAVSADGKGHVLQLFRLHKGYSLQQAGSDINKAFKGDIAAINRVDHKISFRGGSPAKAGKPGIVTMDLNKGRYYVLDQNGGGLSWLIVRGTANRAPVAHKGWITATSYNFVTSKVLPNSGTMTVGNISDQPHFVAIQRVKNGTTHRQVARAFKHHLARNPSWLLHAGTDSGVISPYHHELMSYNLPAGEYLVACWWPDDETGMPHAFMGMWRLVHLG
ncbi:MAG TPA: hypothetical protein VFH38_11530 [Jatrophihabitans sp.]|nr:hypothetical protein [Jatrophihabitans sp.]